MNKQDFIWYLIVAFSILVLSSVIDLILWLYIEFYVPSWVIALMSLGCAIMIYGIIEMVRNG